jgi:23S rRNA (guanosine2251-2'-O)-methyltransferase
VREWIAGRQPVHEVLTAGRRQAFRLWVAEGVQVKGRLDEILKVCLQRKLPVERVSRGRLDALAESHQGVALEASGYPYGALPDILQVAVARTEPPFILILDTLQDPQNLGALLRTAEAAGVHGVLLPLRRTATITPAVVRASSGASEHLVIAQLNLAQGIQELKKQGVWVIGLDSGLHAQPLDRVRLDGAVALVVGNEGQGMRQLVTKSCDITMRLPMRGRVESLNAAVAGSLAIYLFWQARGFNR